MKVELYETTKRTKEEREKAPELGTYNKKKIGNGILVRVLPGDLENWASAVVIKEDGFLAEYDITDVKVVDPLVVGHFVIGQ